MIKKKKEKEGLNIDFGVGKLFGGFFEGIGKLIDLAANLKAGEEIKSEGESSVGKGRKGVFGFTIKTAMGEKSVVEPFGNIKKSSEGPVVKEEREPIVDVFDEKGEIRVYAEMPGLAEKDIKLDLKGDILDISAQGRERKYYKEILLPTKVKLKITTSNYKNGILEVKIKKLV